MRLVLLAGCALMLSGCVIGDFGPSDRYQADFHYTFDLQPDGRINAETFNGSVEIIGWDQDRVEISGTKYASTEEVRDGIRIETHNTPAAIDIRAVKPSERLGSMGARLTMHVPRRALLDRITTSNSSIRVRDIASAAHLKSSNGSIRVANVPGGVEARTSNSSIELDSVRGGVVLRSSNGSIRVENLAGACEAETSNSSISVQADGEAPVRLVTSNGSITLNLTKAPKGSIRAETRNSGITVRLPSNTAARVTADTSNSSISSDFDALRPEKDHLHGTLGSGGPSIDLSSRNGHIRILRGNGD